MEYGTADNGGESASFYDTSSPYSENTTPSFENKTAAIEEWTNKQITLTIVLGLITLVTILGNSFVLYIFISAKRKFRTATHLLLANMAVADLFVGIGVMPMLASITILDMKWIWGDILCFSYDYLHFSLCAASMCSMIGVSVERYIGVRYPLKHKQILTRNRVIIWIIVIWIFALSITTSPLTYWPKMMSGMRYVCSMNLRPEFMLFICTFVYWIPISFTVLMYYLIYRKAVKSFAYSANFQQSKMNRNATNEITKSENESLTAARLKQNRLAKSIACITGLMILFYGPAFALMTLVAFDSPWYTLDLLIFFAWIRYFSSTVNPFMYALAVPGYRQAIRERLFGVGNFKDEVCHLSLTTSYATTDAYDNELKSPLETNPTEEISIKPTGIDQYCTQCGQLLRNVTKNDVNFCNKCHRKVLGASWVLPASWGKSCYFMCPECPTIRFFDGKQTCFCQNCSHQFQPVNQGLPTIKHSALQIPNAGSNPSQNAYVGGTDSENKIFSVNSDKMKSSNMKLIPGQRIPILPPLNPSVTVSNNSLGIRPMIKSKHTPSNSDLRMELHPSDSELKAKVIKRLRESIVPLMDRRSRSITNKVFLSAETNAAGKDAEDAKWVEELDDIITQLQATLKILNEQ